jgi:RNA polymerase sigma factor (sigma-70 family)
MTSSPSMPKASRADSLRYDLDLGKLGDEELVVLAQECAHHPARDELITRCLKVAGQFVGHHASRWRLQEADRQDALQDAVLWIMEAINQYRTTEYVLRGGCHFQSFLHRVLAARFIDFLRRRDRIQRRFPPTARVVLIRKEASHGCRYRGHRGAENGNGSDALQGAEEEELRTRLDQELGQASSVDRQLWELLAAGTPLRRAAVALNISYDAVKRRRRKLIVRLRISLASR